MHSNINISMQAEFTDVSNSGPDWRRVSEDVGCSKRWVPQTVPVNL